MPWQLSNLMDERVKFVARLLDGEQMASVCREFGISRKTGYKIFNDDELKKIEVEINKIILDGLIVKEEFIDKIEAEKEYNLSRLPDENIDKIRIIKVGDYDACPCIGKHAETTKDLGKFKIISQTFQDGVLRVRFKLIAEKD